MATVYYIFLVFAWCISRLSFGAMYRLSNFLAFLLKDVFKYRKSVIESNLENAFPEKDANDLEIIRNNYYRNLSDVILETTKIKGMKPDEFLRRFTFTNYDIIQDLLDKNKSIIVSTGHRGNWEWMGLALGQYIHPVKGMAVVKPLSNKYFDKYMTSLRNYIYPDSVIPFKETFRTLIKLKKRQTITIFAADQTPTKGEINFWTNFLNQDTPFFLGIEKISRSLDMSIVFMDIIRIKRGYYDCRFTLISDEPKNTSEHEITEKYVNLLQESICNQPDNWLWSHKRWKHKRT